MSTLPQIRSTLPSNWRGFTELLTFPPEPATSKNEAIEVVMYQCSVCNELHDYRVDAETCCEGESVDAADCPICRKQCSGPREASDCCLWKDLDAPTRWAMADAVEAGSTWTDQLRDFIAKGKPQ